jgi:hypothetical protein
MGIDPEFPNDCCDVPVFVLDQNQLGGSGGRHFVKMLAINAEAEAVLRPRRAVWS